MSWISDISENVKISPKAIYTDNMVFRLHYRITFRFLLLCTALVCSRQYFQQHIDCLTNNPNKLQKVMNTFCFIKTTYTVVKHHEKKSMLKNQVPFHGLGPHSDEDDIKRHAYYQWVPFFLFIQAIFFYAPHLIWKSYDKGRLEYMVDGFSKQWLVGKERAIRINEDTMIPAAGELRTKRKTMKAKFMSMQRVQTSRDWAVALVSCEFLNLVNLFWQIYFTDIFLAGDFRSLGYKWLYAEDEADLLEPVFPKMTKCTFQSYGATGTIQKIDALCLMALNIIHEKIFVVLWFWYCFLLVATCLGLLWRILTYLLHDHSVAFNRFVWGQACIGPNPHPTDVKIITSSFNFSDWLLLYYIGINMTGDQFKKLVHLLAKDQRRKRPRRQVEYPVKPYTSSEEDD